MENRTAFGYADGWDESSGRYRGLQRADPARAVLDSSTVVVKSEATERQLGAEAAARERETTTDEASAADGDHTHSVVDLEPPPDSLPRTAPRRFHGSIKLKPRLVASGASTIANEIIQHLEGLVGSEVEVTLKIRAKASGPIPEHVVRTVSENCRTLKFDAFRLGRVRSHER